MAEQTNTATTKRTANATKRSTTAKKAAATRSRNQAAAARKRSTAAKKAAATRAELAKTPVDRAQEYAERAVLVPVGAAPRRPRQRRLHRRGPARQRDLAREGREGAGGPPQAPAGRHQALRAPRPHRAQPPRARGQEGPHARRARAAPAPHPRRARDPLDPQGRRRRRPTCSAPASRTSCRRASPAARRSRPRSRSASSASRRTTSPPAGHGEARRRRLSATIRWQKQYLSSLRSGPPPAGRFSVRGSPAPARVCALLEWTAMPSRDEILKALEAVIDPELRRSIVELEMVRSIDAADGARRA